MNAIPLSITRKELSHLTGIPKCTLDRNEKLNEAKVDFPVRPTLYRARDALSLLSVDTSTLTFEEAIPDGVHPPSMLMPLAYQLTPGFVYVLRCQDFVKIGITRDVKKRLKSIRSSNPLPVILIAYFRSEKPIKDEKIIHKNLRRHLLRNEWFRLSEDFKSELSACLARVFGDPVGRLDYESNGIKMD